MAGECQPKKVSTKVELGKAKLLKQTWRKMVWYLVGTLLGVGGSTSLMKVGVRFFTTPPFPRPIAL